VLVLSIIQGQSKGKKFELPDHEPQLIGRSSEAIQFDDNAISRRHAELTPDDGLWFIRDLDSQNGTYVNGTRIRERTRLRAGDQIRVGQTLLVFGQTESKARETVRFVGRDRVAANIERALPSQGLTAQGLISQPASKPSVSPPSLASTPVTNPGTTAASSPAGLPANIPLGASNEDSVILAEPEPRAAAVDHLRVIYRLTSMLTQRVLNRQDLLENVMDLVFSEFFPQRGCIVLAEDLRTSEPVLPVDAPASESKSDAKIEGRYIPVVVRHREVPLDPEEARIHVSRTILSHVILRGEGVLSSNAMTDPRFAKGDSVQRMHIRSAICSPIRFRDKTYGAIYIDSSMANYTFTPEQLALMNAIGQHAGLALANTDLYQEKLQAERLAAIGETVATLSHSIKNILQGLRGGADVVEMGLSKDDLKIAKGGWPIMKRNLDRIISLAVNMLAFSRQRKVELELTSIGPVLEDCAELLENLTKTRQVALILDIDSEVPPIPLDPPMIHQALMNLLTNAVEAVPANDGAVTVRVNFRPAAPPKPETKPETRSEGGRSRVGAMMKPTPPSAARNTQPKRPLESPYIEIAIIDNGPGIPKSKQPWVFEPFHTTKGVRGTGLGLAVAKRVADQHQGVLLLDSEEGKGATFRMILPAEAAGVADPGATT
jgi:signal transduction histidine kinase/pSer/pThr/pTyr-binding forkhead associated (FHA) protein